MRLHYFKRTATGLLALAAVVLLASCSNDNAGQTAGGPRAPGMNGGPRGQGPAPIPAVEVVLAQRGSLPLEERLTGKVIARNQTSIFPEISGPVVEIHVDNGDYVEEGDPLVRIRDTAYRELHQQAISGLAIAQAQTRQAEANLTLLRTQLERTRELTNRQLGSQAALDDIRSQVTVAEANVDLRRAQEQQARSQVQERQLQLEHTVVRAPISGRVGQRNAERGQQVSSSTQLFIIGDLSQVRIEVPLTESMLSYLKEGTPVNVRSDNWPDTVLQSEIARISPFLSSNTLRTQGYVEVDNPDGLLRSGMFVTVDVLYGSSEQAVLIPNTALYRHPQTGQDGVFLMDSPGSEYKPLPQMPGSPPVLTTPRTVTFVPLDIVASGRMASGVRGIEEGDWVVTVGKELLMRSSGEAKARVISWDRMMEMQRMQSRDLFQLIDQRQQHDS
ncbi:MAG: efflux RND transporter periplasmic adaptor subunit [Cellvibrionaceae bacterium]